MNEEVKEPVPTTTTPDELTSLPPPSLAATMEETNEWHLDKDVSIIGTSLRTEIWAPYSLLEAVFGPPTQPANSFASSRWNFSRGTDVATLYDYDFDDLRVTVEEFRASPEKISWHIGAKSDAVGYSLSHWITQKADEYEKERKRKARWPRTHYATLFWYNDEHAETFGRPKHTRAPMAIIATYQPTEDSSVFVGVSQCSASDTFNYAIGRSIALGRAKARMTKEHVFWATEVKKEDSETLRSAIIKLTKVDHEYIDTTIYKFCAEFDLPVRPYQFSSEDKDDEITDETVFNSRE